MLATNSASHENLCQLGSGLRRSGASRLSIQPMPLAMVDQWFHTSALLAESCPPLAKDVSIAA